MQHRLKRTHRHETQRYFEDTRPALLINSQDESWPRYIFLLRRCDKTDDEWHTGSLHTGVFAQLGSNSYTNGDLNPSLLVDSAGLDALHSALCAWRFTRQQNKKYKTFCFKQYRSTWRISMIVTIGSVIVFALCGQDIFPCFKLKLGCPVTTYILQFH